MASQILRLGKRDTGRKEKRRRARKKDKNNEKRKEQAGAERGQAQVKLDDIVLIVVEVVVKAMVEVQLLFWVGGWWVGGRIKQN